jgi:hypothetical protein
VGIPEQKHLQPGSPPSEYEKKTEGVVGEGDLVWSPVEAKYMPVEEFEIEKEHVSEFWGIATKKDGT